MTWAGLALPPEPGARPFPSAEAAWLWCAAHLAARRDGRPPRADMREGGNRPCTPDDIVRELDRLFRVGRVTSAQAEVLREFGDQGRAPNDARAEERAAFVLWKRALAALEVLLVHKGIVRARPPLHLVRRAGMGGPGVPRRRA